MRKVSTIKSNISTSQKPPSINSTKVEINKVSNQYNQIKDYQEHLEDLIHNEQIQRQNLDKKTSLMNENYTTEINNLKRIISDLSKTLYENLENIKNDILKDVKNNSEAFLNSFQSSMKNFEGFEKQNNLNNKNFKFNEIENKLMVLEQVTGSQFSKIKNEIKENSNNINMIQNQLNNNNQNIINEIKEIKEDLLLIKNEIEKLKANKITYNNDILKINRDMNTLNERSEKVSHNMDLLINDVQTKIKHYESINNILNNDFLSIKNDINNQVEELMTNSNKNFMNFQNDSLKEINNLKSQFDKFNMNIIEENQKFINFNQEQFKTQSNNIKQLFEYTNDDIDVLKKKCDTLEGVIRNLRIEMENNINNVEAYLNEKCNELFKNMNQERMINC